MKPFSPEDVMKNLPDYLPDAVISAVNSLLMEKYRGKPVDIKQDDIIDKIRGLDETISRQEIFKKKYLDFESIFTKNGWIVTYDKPGYSESYPASFNFKKK